jgi:tetratricopeptide (TPR) repeat protein
MRSIPTRFGVAAATAAILLAGWIARADTMPPDPLENPGFQHFYNLEYDEALADFTAQAARNPALPDAYNHIAQTILFRQMYRSGALESDLITSANSFLRRSKMVFSSADDKQFSNAIGRALELSQARLKNDPNDTSALYALGVSRGIRANYNFMIKKFVDALGDASAARKLHLRVLELNPKFTDAQLIPGLDEYVISSLPWGWKMLGAAAGLPADRDHGIRMLTVVAQSGRNDRFDAEALLAAIYRREKRPAEALAPLNDLIRNFPRGFLMRIEVAEMYGDLGARDKAMAAIDGVEQMRRSGAPGYARLPEAKIHYTRGNLLFLFNDLDKALEELKIAAAGGGLSAPAAANAWLRTGQIYDLKSQRTQALEAYRRAINLGPDSDVADQAKGYVSSRYKR